MGTITVGERGQVVIPAAARKKLNINTGDRLFVASHPSGEALIVIKLEAMREFIEHLTTSLSLAESADNASNEG